MRGKNWTKKPEFHKKTSILIPNKRFEDSKETKRQKKLVFQKKKGDNHICKNEYYCKR